MLPGHAAACTVGPTRRGERAAGGGTGLFFFDCRNFPRGGSRPPRRRRKLRIFRRSRAQADVRRTRERENFHLCINNNRPFTRRLSGDSLALVRALARFSRSEFRERGRVPPIRLPSTDPLIAAWADCECPRGTETREKERGRGGASE